MNTVKQYLAAIGSKGGKATGASKRRGDAAHYKRLSKKAAAMRALNKLAKLAKSARGLPHRAKSGNVGISDPAHETP